MKGEKQISSGFSLNMTWNQTIDWLDRQATYGAF